VPYISKADRESASQMTWSKILTHVKQTEQCKCDEARRQIGNAIEDGVLKARWADERSRWRSSSPIHIPDDEPPRDADYWVNCKTDPKDPNRVREPPPYDPSLVSKRRATQLDKTRRFRAPLFPEWQILKLWEKSRSSAISATESQAKKFLATRLRANPEMKRHEAWNTCRNRFKLTERGFRFRVWPDARANAGLERRGRKGRKPARR